MSSMILTTTALVLALNGTNTPSEIKYTQESITYESAVSSEEQALKNNISFQTTAPLFSIVDLIDMINAALAEQNAQIAISNAVNNDESKGEGEDNFCFQGELRDSFGEDDVYYEIVASEGSESPDEIIELEVELK